MEAVPVFTLAWHSRKSIESEERRTLREEGHTQVVVSHSFEAVLELADRIAVLYQGRIADVVRPSEVDKQVLTDPITTGHR